MTAETFGAVSKRRSASSHLTLRKFEGIALDATFTTAMETATTIADVLVALDVLIASDRQTTANSTGGATSSLS